MNILKTVLGGIWSGMKICASFVWHYVGGAVMGGLVPVAVASIAAKHLVIPDGTVESIGSAVGLMWGAAQHSNNQEIAKASNLVSPAQVSTLVQNELAKVGKIAVKMLFFALALFALAAPLKAQTTKTGWGINPQFAAPYMFGQDATGTFVSIPSFGMGADIGWKEFTVIGDQKSIKYSLGLVLSGNIAQAQPSGPKSVVNGMIGLEAGYKGIDLIFGNQALGDTLTGPGGSRWLISIGFDTSGLLGGWQPF